jgi:hypothetical protein
MKKCSSQINATKQAIQICNIDCIFSNYQDLDKDHQLPQKLVKVMDELADSIQREIRSTFEIECKGEGSGNRN